MTERSRREKKLYATQFRFRSITAVFTCLAVCALLIFTASRAFALINPDFTPIHLTEQSSRILWMEVRAPADDEDPMETFNIQVLKGESDPPETLTLQPIDEHEGWRIREDIFFDTDTVTAILFTTGTEPGDEGDFAGGSLHLGGEWFAISRAEDEVWQVSEDTVDMLAVWNGRTEMLHRTVNYILTTPRPAVPVVVGYTWESYNLIGEVEGASADVHPVDLNGDGEYVLFVLAEGGDRVFSYLPGEGGFVDSTADLGVSTSSKAAAFADMNANGRLDLVSWDGTRLSVALQCEEGTFGGESVSTEPGHELLGLATLQAGGKTAVLLTANQGPPILAVLDGENISLNAVYEPDDEFPGAAMGEPRRCVVADFTGNGLADIVQPYEEGGLFYAGRADGTFAPPAEAGELYSGRGNAKTYTADFDHDGLLDLFIVGDEGHFLWENRGDGRFEEITHTGEPDYIAGPGCSGAAVGELNSDGRRDFVLFYQRRALHPFFNRGFSAFGFAIEMDVAGGEEFAAVYSGQQCGALTDVNRNGAQDLVTVLNDGTVWVLLRTTERPLALSVRVNLDTEAGAGPVHVTARDGDRSLGAWNVSSGVAGACFGKEHPGPITLQWRLPGEELQETTFVIDRGPVRVNIEADGGFSRSVRRRPGDSWQPVR